MQPLVVEVLREDPREPVVVDGGLDEAQVGFRGLVAVDAVAVRRGRRHEIRVEAGGVHEDDVELETDSVLYHLRKLQDELV
jgi:hypothetical protein